MKRFRLTSAHLLYLFIALSALALDYVTKYLASRYLRPIGTYKLIDGVFQLTYRENTGAAFSILEGQRVFFVIISVIFVLFLGFVLLSGVIRSVPASCAAALILGGGMGNFVDRAVAGYVVDMFDFCLINFAVFNVADICITCGSALFLIIYVFHKGEMLKWN